MKRELGMKFLCLFSALFSKVKCPCGGNVYLGFSFSDAWKWFEDNIFIQFLVGMFLIVDENHFVIPRSFTSNYNLTGFYSWRNTTKGSWFMQSLCAELDENGKRYDLLTLLTFVSQRVAYDFESNTPDTPTMHQQKQIPCELVKNVANFQIFKSLFFLGTTTMLTRILRFNDKSI